MNFGVRGQFRARAGASPPFPPKNQGRQSPTYDLG
jgi:hypothetical protein